MRPVKPGDPISQHLTRENWNKIIKGHQNPPQKPDPRKTPNHDMVIVQGAFDAGMYTAVDLIAPVYDPEAAFEDDIESHFYSYPHMSVANTVNDPLWVIVQGEMESGLPTYAVITGFTWAYVNVTDLTDDYVGPNSSNNGLESKAGATLARLIYNPTNSTGNHYVLIHKSLAVTPQANRLVQPNADISGGSSGTATIFEDDLSTLSSDTLTLHNIASNTTMPGGCRIIAHYVSDADKWIGAPNVTDLQVDGVDLELRRNCDWTVWHTGRNCSDTGGGSGSGSSVTPSGGGL